ncbi:MAG TPA: DUF4229 domain-containing protein [Mycobacteriales bacterium]|nr:DUF4229 domain-containing protein [Mycobacteriales bacterium]
MGRAAATYALARFGLFLLVALVLWGVADLLDADLNGLPLLLGAAIVSSALGYVLFARQRIALAEAVDAQRRARADDVAARAARLEIES